MDKLNMNNDVGPDSKPLGEPVAWPGLDTSSCDGCGKCIDLCPCGMFAQGAAGKIKFVKGQNCTLGRACKKCLVFCPWNAIQLIDADGYRIELDEEFSCLVFGSELPPGAIDSMD